MSNVRLPSDGRSAPYARVPSAHSDSPSVTRRDIARRMPPAEMQAHVMAYVRAGGLPAPTAFHASADGQLFLIFPDGATSSVDRWVAELGMCLPFRSPWGTYIAWTKPAAWYGWQVTARCDLEPAAPRIELREYGGTIEAVAPPIDPAHPARRLILGVAKHRDREDDYMVILRGDATGPQFVATHDDAVQALVTGQIAGAR
jgi:hypothetical protein